MKKTVCYCSNVSEETILKVVENGATTLDDIRKSTGACTLGQCETFSPTKKCCSPVILEILNRNIKE